ncbi:hypothetical protein EXIGLDRAFT_695699 [Exidia glandulosa HHB12029]|uniref:Uncharacterized protein n=1 Tax=Exidia glandulosa HHB12029 TaxID=1314781 RepID=A0A165FPK6_EXIGL|nr:hypothetical protein EXIGLDRAFT_695699 [Exidia glandulosa HHB12029]
MSARTTLPMDLNIELPMPALVRTYSASSIDSSPPTTPTSAEYLGRPFDEIDTKKQIIAQNKSLPSPRRRTVAQKQKEQDALSAMQVVFLVGMLFVDALRIMSWLPLCLRIIFKELWIVLECELKNQGVDAENVKRALGAVIAMVVCYCIFF